MLLGAVSVVQTARLRAFETNERSLAKFSEMMDPCFVGRNAAVLQNTQFAFTEETTRKRMNNAATPKPGRFEEEWAKLDLAPMVMRASLILTSVKPELTVDGTLQTRTMLAPFDCEEVRVVHGEEEDQSAGRLVVPKLPDGVRNEEQGPSSSVKNPRRNDGQGGSRRSEETMQQDPDQSEKEDVKASTGGMSSLDLNFLSDFENGTDTLEATTEPADEGTSKLEPPSAFIERNRNLPESSSPSNSKNAEKKLLRELQRRRRIEGTARVPFLGTLPEEEWEVRLRDHENRTGCSMDRVAFIPKIGLNRPLMREVLDKLDECEWRLSELLIDTATDENEVISPIKTTPQESKEEVVYLPRTRKGTMRSKMVIDKINDMKKKLGSKVTLRKAGKNVDSEISIKAVNSKPKESASKKPWTWDRVMTDCLALTELLTNVATVPPILMVGIKLASYTTKRSDRTLTGATLEMEILSQCGESNLQDFKTSSMNHGKGSVVGQLIPVEYNRLIVSEAVSVDEPAGGYMEVALENKSAMEGYLETMMQGTTLKQKADGTLVSSELQKETIEQLVSIPWRAVVLRYFEEEMRTTPKIHALIEIPNVRTELQLRFAWCMTGLTRGEYDLDERKRLKGEKVFLMTSLRDLITQEGATVACAKRRDALCFIRFMIK